MGPIPELCVHPPPDDEESLAGGFNAKEQQEQRKGRSRRRDSEASRSPSSAMASLRPTPLQSRRGTLDSVEMVERYQLSKKPPRSGSHSPSQYESRRRLSSFGTQRRIFLDLIRKHGSKLSLNRKFSEASKGDEQGGDPGRLSRDRALAKNQLTIALSALYSKLLIILGVTLPITEFVTTKAPANFHQGFYLYLHGVSILFCVFLFVARYRRQTQLEFLTRCEDGKEKRTGMNTVASGSANHSASFYLRIGAIAFGIGSLVYSALDFGQYFELADDDQCGNALVALMPAVRMVLCVVQMQFVIVSGKDFGLDHHTLTSRFGLMHMLATNVCEWLYVLVEEAKHEIVHLGHPTANVAVHAVGAEPTNVSITAGPEDLKLHCRTSNIMGSLVNNAAPFLFPCTIEYSLICALTLYDLWTVLNRNSDPSKRKSAPERPDRGVTGRPANRFSIDCSNAQKGLFGGIITIVMTFIVLIMYFVLRRERDLQGAATLEIVVYELVLYSSTLAAVVGAMIRMRDLRVTTQRAGRGAGSLRATPPLPLDCHLLLVTQTGIYIYGVFSIIGTYHTHGRLLHLAVVSEILGLAQTSLQTLFVLSSWWRRCKGAHQNRTKPGRELITFLLVANLAAWMVNALVKSNASFRPLIMGFYGAGAWSIIAHVSMPLAIFYRFHSSICLFEIWKNSYKARYNET
ncbi:AGAP013356-PA-like protein [Anopheles sinensis]|uniref:AGAP013356-PA-like protein n=1 Tax=Anopheles sinensis TaxID=74873 RepID=A0A084VJ18_ANOSI|nr:AGAP013356-PA-like protein [Anopheles sinensis]